MGINLDLLGGYLVWPVLVILALASAVAIRWLPEKAEGRLKEDGHDS